MPEVFRGAREVGCRLLVGFLFLFLPLTSLWAAERPNIIFLLADDMRADATGYAGHPIIQTPHLDSLARESTVFTNAFVTTAICAVSRASIFSGQYARRHGIYDFATRFSDESWARTYPALLRVNGYRVGFIGKFGVGNRAPTNTFHYWDGFNGQGRYFQPGDTNHLTHFMGESALRFLGENDQRPFCLSISFKAPHAQDGQRAREFPPDLRDEQLYADQKMPAARTVSEEAFARLPAFLKTSEARNRWEYRFANEEMRQKTVRDYLRLITGIDREIGRIRERLAELGLEKNTIIIFSSDHGFYLGEHGLAGKWFMHEESIRIPMVIFDPAANAPRGRTVGAFALNIDIAPTILDYAGVKIPELMQGRSLRPWVLGKTPEDWRTDFFYEHHFPYGGKIPNSEGVRTAEWKYIRYTESEPVVEQVYHLTRDPFEEENLASLPRHQEKIEELRARWQQFREELE